MNPPLHHGDEPPTLTLDPVPLEPPESLRDRQIKALLAHARHTAERVDELAASVADLVTCHHKLRDQLSAHIVTEESWQLRFSKDLSENTKATDAVREWTARRTWWRGFRERLAGLKGWIVGIASTIAAVVGAWIAIAQAWGTKGGGP